MGIIKKFTAKPRDYGYEAQQAAEARLDAIWAAEAEADETGDDSAWADVEISAPWDGCTTCIVREVLDAAWPILREAALAGDAE